VANTTREGYSSIGPSNRDNLLGFWAWLAISTMREAVDELEDELKRANAGVRLAVKEAVMGKRLGRTKRGAIVIDV
jgi:hypothetical protein